MNTAKKAAGPRSAPKRVAVIKNRHTDAELDEMEERWANHSGPRLTLTEILTIEKAKTDNDCTM